MRERASKIHASLKLDRSEPEGTHLILFTWGHRLPVAVALIVKSLFPLKNAWRLRETREILDHKSASSKLRIKHPGMAFGMHP
jgi:hypothetical protein